jgi:hypothetical protein
MRRDLSLIREILIAVETSDQSWGMDVPVIADHQREHIVHHVGLLLDAGYITAIDASTLDGRDFMQIHLTWAGHEFLDALRSESAWAKVKDAVKRAGGSLSFELIKEVGLSAAKEALKLA